MGGSLHINDVQLSLSGLKKKHQRLISGRKRGYLLYQDGSILIAQSKRKYQYMYRKRN